MDFDVIVIGSGFGGAITGCRLAEAGARVLILERGRRWSYEQSNADFFPRKLDDEDRWLWSHSDPERKHGWLDLRVFPHMAVAAGAGVGGGSLIYANISVEAPEEAFRPRPGLPSWPSGFGKSELKDDYDRVAKVMRVRDLPRAQWSSRTYLMKEAAEAIGRGDRFYPVPLAVNFDDNLTINLADGKRPARDPSSIRPNEYGVNQGTCYHCGDCDVGCDVNARNTLDTNYLAMAETKYGAEIRPLHIVTSIEPVPGGYRVHFDRLVNAGSAASPSTASRVTGGSQTAARVIVAAGSLGSTELLLRCRDVTRTLRRLSPHLGRNWSSNGDFLTPAFYAHREVQPSPSQGPTITSVIDFLDGSEEGQSFWVQDGGFPDLMAQYAKKVGASHGGVWTWILLDALRIAAKGEESAATRMMPWFGQAVDGGDGVLRMRRKWLGLLGPRELYLDWNVAKSKSAMDALIGMYARLAKATGGEPAIPPSWSIFRGLVTPHPLGGCGMGDTAETGVVDHAGEVFGHPGLYVADGAIIPRPLGVNPSRTIGALAERIARLIIQKDGRTYHPYAPRTFAGGNGVSMSHTIGQTFPEPARPAGLGLRFTETMHGFVSGDATNDYSTAEQAGRRDGNTLRFLLTVATDDLDRLIRDDQHPAAISGEVTAPALSPFPLTVENGEFHLFVDDRAEVAVKLMKYAMRLRTADGSPYSFQGTKTIHPGSPLHIWPETTTLAIDVTEGDAPGGKLALRGILTMTPADFARQLTTVEVTGARSEVERLEGIARFGEYFAGVLFQTYGGIFSRPTPIRPDAPPRRRRALRVGAPEVHFFTTPDGLNLRLTRYRGGSKGPLMMVHGLGVSSLIFSIDTIDTNLLEFFYAHGYDVWLLDYRSSIELPYTEGPYTGDDVATRDYPAAVAEVRRLTGAASIQCLVHCFGASTFFMAMLAGLEGVRSAAVSQIGAHMLVEPVAHAMAGAHVPEILDRVFHVREMSARTGTDFFDRLEDTLLRAFPVNAGPGDTNPVSRRISFLYGQLYDLAQLNEDTYNIGLGEMFGIAGIRSLEHLAACIRAGHAVGADGSDVYLPHVGRLAIPMVIVHGEDNRCWRPESTLRTLEWLQAANDPGLYARHVVPGYGHIDCIFGKNAARDVYPLFLDHLEKTAAS